jgi:hypothetical protein
MSDNQLPTAELAVQEEPSSPIAKKKFTLSEDWLAVIIGGTILIAFLFVAVSDLAE